MSSLDLSSMRGLLSKSIASLNTNKLNGLLAEIAFRQHLQSLGFGDRVSRGGWIARRVGSGEFAHRTAVFFPETIMPEVSYPVGRVLPAPDMGLHTICATFHQTGISAYYCAGEVGDVNDPQSLNWKVIQLGLPSQQPYVALTQAVGGLFTPRVRRYNHLRNSTNTSGIPASSIPEEFSKEHFRVSFQTPFMAEVSDVDGIFWGQQYTYPLEIKEKTAATDKRLGAYFGLDVGPFVKLAHFAARQGNLRSLFVVREIENQATRELVKWWFITFEQLARFASWTPRAGGVGMSGGSSSVVCVPRAEFRELSSSNLAQL